MNAPYACRDQQGRLQSDDDIWTFVFKVDIDSSKSFQVWASDTSDCILNEERNGANKKCIQIGEGTTVSAQNQHTIEISSRDIALAMPNVTYTSGECIDPAATPSRASSTSPSCT
ncbi:MAG: hypothetical protein R3F14_22520 [Polyangiaceae bacterium]